MSRYAAASGRAPPTSTSTQPTTPPTTAVSLDPVTGAIVPGTKACCHTSSVPAQVSTHAASDAYLTALYSVLGVAFAAGVGYAGYRYYTDVYAKRTGAGKDGIVEKRAAYPVKEVSDERDIDRAIQQAQDTASPGATVFVLVEGARDPLTGVSWCGDCERAEPIVERVFNDERGRVSLVRAPVARSSYKGNAAHPYRSHPQLRLQRIPTLYRMGPAGRVVDQLIETELHDETRVRNFVKA